MPIITSRVTIDVPSIGRLPAQKGTTLNFGNVKREAVMGDSGLLGHGEEFTDAPSITCKLSDTVGLDKDKLQNVVDETITIQSNNNQAWTLNNGFCSSVLEIDTSSGDIDITFSGSELIKV